ncbi:MAG: SDR family oxidoreductase [Candidatus Competibacteraceae bacterium]
MTVFANFEQIKEGDIGSLIKVITETDIRRFVEMTGDDNPLHVDSEYASTTSFKEIVVHGMLGASFISTVIGTQLPGPGALWVSQSMEFNLPVRLGDTLTVTCKVLRKHERDHLLELETRITNQHGQIVLRGQGKVKVLEPPQPQIIARTAKCQVAIVTGGAGGIGQVICQKLASEGFSVVVNYLSGQERAESLLRKINHDALRAIAVQADVSTPEGVNKLYQEALRRFGGVSVLVNAASPRIVARLIDELQWEDVERHLNVQLKSALLMIKACCPTMAAGGYGRIISLTSQAWDGAPVPGWTAYALAKGGLATLAHYLAAELGPSGITVNCVSPGMIDTSFISGISEKQQLLVARQTPMRRLGHPEDVAAAVAFLASDKASYITGQNLRVNGGGSMSW